MITSTAIEIVHTADGHTQDFNTHFYVPFAGAVHVSVNAAEVPASRFSVSGLRLSAGATVRLLDMPAEGVLVRIWRKTAPLIQDYDFQYNASMPSEVIGFALDRLFCAVQEAAAGADVFATKGELKAEVSRLDLVKADKDDQRFHTHNNKMELDKIGEAAGAPTWNGMEWPVPDFRTGFAEIDLSDQMDGVRKDFYVGGLLRPTVPLALYYAGQRQLAGVNYTVNYDAASITVLFDKAPEAGDERRLVLLAGNFDTSLALQNIIMGIYPIGSIFIHYESTNPSGILGFGTWQRIAHGRMLVGVSEDDNDVNAAGREGGAKTVAVTTANLPAVKINIPQVAVQMNPVENHTHPLPGAAPGGNGNQGTGQALATDHRGNTAWAYGTLNSTTSLAGGHTPTGVVPQHETGVLGQGTALNKMPPYYTVYMWRRVA